MRILYVSNPSTTMCGVANYGRQCVVAARAAGIDITEWDATIGSRTLPEDAMDYDRIHLNWIAGTIGHLQAIDIPRGPRVSIFLHEPPSGPEEIIDRCDLVIAAEPMDGAYLFEPPCPSYEPMSDWAHQPQGMRETVLGLTGIRKSGLDRLEPIVDAHNKNIAKLYDLEPGEVGPDQWRVSSGMRGPDSWLSDDAEIERLAQCTLSVCHYHGGYPGQATGVMMAIAARRPVLINSNRMLENLWPYEGELYRVEDMRDGIDAILQDIKDCREKRPYKLAESRSWAKRIHLLKAIWGA